MASDSKSSVRTANALDVTRMMAINEASLAENYPRGQWEAVVRDSGRGISLVAMDNANKTQKQKQRCHGYALVYRVPQTACCNCVAVDHDHVDERCNDCRMNNVKYCPQWRLGSFAVTERSRGKGIGSMLLQTLVAMADDEQKLNSEEHRPHLLSLHVRDTNATARRLYEKFGFEAHSRRLGYYDDGEDGVFMIRAIRRKEEKEVK